MQLSVVCDCEGSLHLDSSECAVSFRLGKWDMLWRLGGGTRLRLPGQISLRVYVYPVTLTVQPLWSILTLTPGTHRERWH